MTELGNKRYLTLVIRLLVDTQGQIQQGTAVDLSGQSVSQFRQLDELPILIADWVAAWVQEQKGKQS
jgi:hypothetical protein